MFVGHTKKDEFKMTMAAQRTLMENFRVGNINLVVATSVAEEGIGKLSLYFQIRCKISLFGNDITRLLLI
jgi:hypothetical protein